MNSEDKELLRVLTMLAVWALLFIWLLGLTIIGLNWLSRVLGVQ